MSEKENRNLLMNMVVVVLGLMVLILLYALIIPHVLPPTDPGRVDNPAHLVGEIIQVEVRNGCGVTGIVAQTTEFLRRHGFDVVEVGDFTSFDEDSTLIIDRVGDLKAAKKVARIMGVSDTHVLQEISPDFFLDVSVILGKDYVSLHPFQSP